MKKVKLEYYDQNEEFAACLPRTGFLERECHLVGEESWFLLRLDEEIQFQYENNSGQYRLIKTNWLLIRSRSKDHDLNDSAPTPVFILFPLVGDIGEFNEFDFGKEFLHVAWGTCSAS